MAYTITREMIPINVLGMNSPMEFSMPGGVTIEATGPDVVSIFEELSQSLHIHTTTSNNVSVGTSTAATVSEIEGLKDQIQLLKDDIENLKMLLLQN